MFPLIVRLHEHILLKLICLAQIDGRLCIVVLRALTALLREATGTRECMLLTTQWQSMPLG